MGSKALLLIGVATVCGMIASIGLSQLTSRPIVVNARASVRQRIYVAQYDIAPGQPLSQDNLRLESWESDSVPPDTLLRLEDALGKVCRESLQRGEPIQMNALTVVAEKSPPAIASTPPIPPTPVAQSVVAQTGATPTPESVASKPAVAADAAPAARAEVVVKSVEAVTTPTEKVETIRLSPPAVTAADSSGNREPSPSPEVSIAEQLPSSTAETSDAAPPTPRTKRGAPAQVTASGFITDEGWVMTIYKSGGVKVLRWRPTSESSSGQPRGTSIEQSARPMSDPKKG